MRFSIDSNILVYSLQTGAKQADIAERILFKAIGTDCILTNQALGEYLNVIRRKHPSLVREARSIVAHWSLVFSVAPTETKQLVQASALAERHRLQFWDSVILIVAGSAGAECLLTEDMQDGATFSGVQLINPFRPENAALIDALLA